MGNQMNRRQEQKTFQSILNQVASQNASQIMQRAKVANRVAKSVRGTARQRAYEVKTTALVNLTQRFPEQVFISNDPRTPDYVLVRTVGAHFGLHAPARQFQRENKR